MTVHAIEPGATQPPPDSRKATLSLGCLSHTPPQIMLMQASIISMVCEMMCWAPRPSKRSMPTVGMPLLPRSWRPMQKSSSSASRQNGS
jgi:hypothetical protein